MAQEKSKRQFFEEHMRYVTAQEVDTNDWCQVWTITC